MSCDAMIVVAGDRVDDDALDRAARRLAELERRWTRFDDDSEISGLNAAKGSPRRCSDDTVALVEAMVRAWHATDGAFDPSLLGSLVELGYATSRTDQTKRTSIDVDVAISRRVDEIAVDRAAGVVRLPAGLHLDPGGIGKGLAADLLTGELLGVATGALVEIGGDIRVRGDGPDDGAWTIAVAHPAGGETEYVRLRDGGVATSTSRLRSWLTGDRRHHHLLDPASGRSTDGDVIGCTVVAGTAAWAEAFTKVAFVRGADEAIEQYERLGVAALVVLDDGTTVTTARWSAFAA